MKKKSLYAAAAGLALVLLAACNMAEPEITLKAAVRISMNPEESRTVKPAVGKDYIRDNVTRWELRGEKTGEPEKHLAEFPQLAPGEAKTVYLEPGEWAFSLAGYTGDKGDNEILRGELAKRTIVSGPNELKFTVAPVLGGPGQVQITVTLPPNHGITAARIYVDQEPAVPLSIQSADPNDPADKDKFVYYNGSMAAGDYYISIRLYIGSELHGAVSEIVQVRQNLLSEATYDLDWNQLNLKYAITYHPNGGIWSEGPAGYYETVKGFTLPDGGDLTHEGYTFAGWYEDSRFYGNAVTEVAPGTAAEDKDFYAKWTGIPYTVAYDKNAGDATGSTSSTTHVYGTASSLAGGNGFSRTGYTFTEWNTDADGTGTSYAAGAGVTDLSSTGGTVTLYAQWKVNTYTVEYRGNGSTGGSTTSTTHTYGVSSNLAGNNIFTKTGYTFTGWNTAANGKGTPYAAGASVINLTTANGEKILLYAQWQSYTPSSTLTLTNGEFLGPADSTSPKIGFTAGGYTGKAEARYLVKAKAESQPGFEDVIAFGTSLGSLAPKTHTLQINLPSTNNSLYYVYVVLLKDQEYSAVLPIDAGMVSTWDGTGRFVGFSYDGATAAWSSDGGLSWNEADTGLTFGVTSIAYGNGVFVAGGEGYTAWSDNGGRTWNSVELLPASSANWANMAYGNGVFVTVDKGVPEVHNTLGKSRTAAYSIDNGKTWTLTILPSEDYWGPVIYGEGVFVTIAAGSNYTTYSSTNAAYSKDYGKTWQPATLPKNEYWTAAAYGNGGFIAIPDNNTRVAWSDNGETWSSEGLAMLPFPRLFYSVTCGNGVFVSVRFTTSDEYCKAIYSDDNGQTWNVVDVGRPRKGSNYVGDVVFGNGTFLVTTNDGLSLYSKNNGQTWAQGGEFSFNIMQSMAYGAR